MRIIARVDIKGEFVIKGVCFEGLRKLGNPKEFCNKYYIQGADEILITDVVASLYGRNNLFSLIKKITEKVFIPVCLSGGIRNLKDIQLSLDSGADKVAINTAIVKNISFLKSAVKNFGTSNIVASIEAKKVKEKIWEVYIYNGREKTGINIIEWIKKINDIGCGEILITSVDRDGTNSGFDKSLVETVAKLNLQMPVIVSGGFGNLQDIIDIKKFLHENDALAIGTQLHYNKVKINELKKKLK